MTDDDVPYSSPPASSSSEGGKSIKGENTSSASRHLEASVPSTFDNFLREREEKEAAQQSGQGAFAAPPSLLETKPMEPNGDHPHVPHATDMLRHFDEVKQVRQEEEGIRQKIEGEKEASKRDNVARASENEAQAGRVAAIANEASQATAEWRGQMGAVHSDQQAGFAAHHSQELAGAQQHESEERRRSNGMSL